MQLVGRFSPAPISTPAPGLGAGGSQPVPGFDSRVLLVDDDPDITRLLGRQLAVKGLDSCASHNCREALAALDREHFAVVVLDYALPTQTGASIIEYIHHRGIDTAVILLTASMSIMTAVDCTARGSVFRILTKPVAHDEFVRAVHEAGCFAERFLSPSRAA